MAAARAPVGFDPEAAAAAAGGGRPGFDFPDRIPGPPDADPSRQGMYKGKYRWVMHCNVDLFWKQYQQCLLGTPHARACTGV
jgi:hypothetical protein